MTYSFFFGIDIPDERATERPHLRYHMFVKTNLGLCNDDRRMLDTFNIWCGSLDWEKKADKLTYEHCFDAALACSQSIGYVQLCDDNGNVLVRFDHGHVINEGA